MQAARDVEDICDDTIQTKRESSDVDGRRNWAKLWGNNTGVAHGNKLTESRVAEYNGNYNSV